MNAAVTFRPMCEADVPLLHEWIHRPHVAAWWSRGDTHDSVEDTKRKYLPCLDDRSAAKGYIALVSGEPIGFIQSYVAIGCGDGWWEDETDPGVCGIDQFLCEGDKLGQGLGSRMVEAFVRNLFEDPAVTKVQTDPDPSNTRAIRCYEKAGFRRVGNIATPDGPALLMIVERSATPQIPEMMTKPLTPPTSIDEYIATFSPAVQVILERIRSTIRDAVPDAQETISYRIPAFTRDGVLVYFAAFKAHIGFYPPVRGDARLEKAVAPYAGEKGNLRFPLDRPIPYALIERIVKHRVKQTSAKARPRSAR